jgi:hypothetical protein
MPILQVRAIKVLPDKEIIFEVTCPRDKVNRELAQQIEDWAAKHKSNDEFCEVLDSIWPASGANPFVYLIQSGYEIHISEAA